MMQHKLSALALAVALLCAPSTSVLAFAPAAAPSALTAAAAAQQDDTPPDVEQAMFTRGQNFYNQGRYEQAATVFRDFLKTYPNSIITDLTLLWLGRTYIAQGRLTDAEGVGIARLMACGRGVGVTCARSVELGVAAGCGVAPRAASSVRAACSSPS